MTQDDNDRWADARCIECGRHLLRRGLLCPECRAKFKSPDDDWESIDQA